MWKLTYRWARQSHPNKSRWWAVDRYYGQFNKSKQNRWVFGDQDSGAYLPKFAWTKIVRMRWSPGQPRPMTRRWPAIGTNAKSSHRHR
jgi:RNA-directed DNA polymerase